MWEMDLLRALKDRFPVPQPIDWLVVRGLLWIAILAQGSRSEQIARRPLARSAWIAKNRARLAAAASG